MAAVSPGRANDWATAVNGNWTDTTKWSPAAVPTSSDTAVFNATGQVGAEVVTIDTAAQAQSLTFANTGTTTLQNDLANARTLTVGNITTNAGAGVVTIRNNTTSGSLGLVVNSGGATWTNSSSNNMVISSVVSGAPTSLTIAGTKGIELRNLGNTFTGSVSINGTSASLVVEGSGTTAGDGALGNAGNDINLSNGGSLTIGATAGNIILNSLRDINVSSGAKLGLGAFSGSYQNVTGNIAGTGGLTFSSNSSNYILSGNNTYGGTTLLSGLVRISSQANIGGANSAIGTNSSTFTTMGLAIMGTEITNMSGHTFSYAGETMALDIQDANNFFTWDQSYTKTANSASAAGFTKLGQGTMNVTVVQKVQNDGAGAGIALDFRGGTYLLDTQAGGAIRSATGTVLGVNVQNRIGFGGGTFEILGKNDGTSYTQNMGSVKLVAGGGKILIDNNAGSGTTTLNLGDFTSLNVAAAPAGGTLNIRVANLGTGSAAVTTTELNSTGGIIGAGRVIYTDASNVSGFATNTTNTSGGMIGRYTSATAGVGDATVGSGVNYTLTGSSGPLSAATYANTVQISTSGTGQSLDLGTQTYTLTTGGLLFTGTDNYSIANGTLKSATSTASDLLIHQYGAGNLTIGAIIANGTGASTLTKAGSGTLILSGVNTYSGITYINEGAISIGASNNLGSGNLSINGGTLKTTAGFTNARGVTLGGNGGTFDVADGTTSTMSGAISGTSGHLTLSNSGTGTGILVLSGNNNFGGGVHINSGVLKLGSAQAISVAGANTLTFGSGTTETLQLNGFNAAVAGLTSASANSVVENGSASTATVFSVYNGADNTYAGTLRNGGTASLALNKGGSGTLRLTGTNAYTGGTTVNGGTLEGTTSGLQGAITNNATVSFNQATSGTYSGAISGTGALSKSGSGAVTLSGSNTYGGTTTVVAGTLLISGTHTSAGAYLVNSGGTLGGIGSITTDNNAGITLAAGAKLAPGASPGTLTASLGTGTMDITGAVTSTNSGALVFELGAIGSGTSDSFALNAGTLNIGSGLLEFDDFNFTTLGGFTTGQYVLFNLDNSLAFLSGSLGSGVSGTLGGFNGVLAISGNDLVLNVAAVPEPSTYILLSAGLGALVWLRRRKSV